MSDEEHRPGNAVPTAGVVQLLASVCLLSSAWPLTKMARRWLAAALGLAGVIVLINPWAIDWSAHGILIGLTTPAISLILANVLLGEPITTDLLIGSGLIMAGVACAAWPGRRVR